MKRMTAAVLALAIPFLAAAPAGGQNSAHVQKLLLTGQCANCDLTGADLVEAHLIGADLRGADLREADLTRANLEGADLEGANLVGANLTDAFLTNASLRNADLSGANLTQAKLYFVDVAGAVFDNITLTQAEVVDTPISVGGD